MYFPSENGRNSGVDHCPFTILLLARDPKPVWICGFRYETMNTHSSPDGMNVHGPSCKPVEMKFAPGMIEQFRRGDFTGIVPVIINITPITSALPILGMAASEVHAG